MGSRKNPVWRVVVADQRSPRDGRVIETIGRYNAQVEPSEIVLDDERLQHWLSRTVDLLRDPNAADGAVDQLVAWLGSRTEGGE